MSIEVSSSTMASARPLWASKLWRAMPASRQTCQQSSQRRRGQTSFALCTLDWLRISASPMQSARRLAIRLVQSQGEQAVQCPVYPVCLVAAHTEQARVPSATCAVADACLLPQRPRGDGTGRSTLTRRGTLPFAALFLLISVYSIPIVIFNCVSGRCACRPGNSQ